jgi:hypothetical protein
MPSSRGSATERSTATKSMPEGVVGFEHGAAVVEDLAGVAGAPGAQQRAVGVE